MTHAVNTPEGVLTRLKSKLCLALGIDIHKLKILIDRFVCANFMLAQNSKTHFAKVNIYNELTKDKMTIKVFFKLLRVLNIKKIKISITVTTLKDKEVTVHEDITLLSPVNTEHQGDNNV